MKKPTQFEVETKKLVGNWLKHVADLLEKYPDQQEEIMNEFNKKIVEFQDALHEAGNK